MKPHCLWLIIFYKNVQTSGGNNNDDYSHHHETTEKLQFQIQLPIDEGELHDINQLLEEISNTLDSINMGISTNAMFSSSFYSDITAVFLATFLAQIEEPNYKSSVIYKNEEIRLIVLFLMQMNDIIKKIQLYIILIKIHYSLSSKDNDKNLCQMIIQTKKDIERIIKIKLGKIMEQENEYCEIRDKIAVEINARIPTDDLSQKEKESVFFAAKRLDYKTGIKNEKIKILIGHIMGQNSIIIGENGIFMADLMYVELSLKKIKLTPEVDVKILQQELQKLNLIYNNQRALKEKHKKIKEFLNKSITLKSLNDINLIISTCEGPCSNKNLNINPKLHYQIADKNENITLRKIQIDVLKQIYKTRELIKVLENECQRLIRVSSTRIAQNLCIPPKNATAENI